MYASTRSFNSTPKRLPSSITKASLPQHNASKWGRNHFYSKVREHGCKSQSGPVRGTTKPKQIGHTQNAAEKCQFLVCAQNVCNHLQAFNFFNDLDPTGPFLS